MNIHSEDGGATIAGRARREWYEGMKSNVNGRGCEIVRFAKRSGRILVRWLEEAHWADTRMIRPLVRQGRTQWVGLYQIEPKIILP